MDLTEPLPITIALVLVFLTSLFWSIYYQCSLVVESSAQLSGNSSRFEDLVDATKGGNLLFRFLHRPKEGRALRAVAPEISEIVTETQRWPNEVSFRSCRPWLNCRGRICSSCVITRSGAR